MATQEQVADGPDLIALLLCWLKKDNFVHGIQGVGISELDLITPFQWPWDPKSSRPGSHSFPSVGSTIQDVKKDMHT
eukprot:scaffold111443_cov13-Tisochrysis_lutea.AAC.1